MEKFTEEDAKELGIPLGLLDLWQERMDWLWSSMRGYQNEVKGSCKCWAGENEIKYISPEKKEYTVKIEFYNSEYLCLKVIGEEGFELSVEHAELLNRKGCCRIVADALTYQNFI